MLDEEAKPDGTQAIRRAANILRYIASGSREGVSLRDVSQAMGLSRSTTHRILKCLSDEGLVATSGNSRRHVIGSLTFELGLATSNLQHDLMTWRGVVDDLARETGVTAYLMGRSGIECVCLHRAEGSGVVRVIPVELGQRRPLGVGAGATALLASAADPDLNRVLKAIEPHLHIYPALSLERIRSNVEKARRLGFAESEGTVVREVYGLGVAVASAQGPAMLALSLAAHSSIATPERIAAWKKTLVRMVREHRQPASAAPAAASPVPGGG